MSFTFDPEDISTDLAKVRLKVGDTNSDDRLLTDEQIAFILTESPNLNEAAADSCDAIVAFLARDVDRSNLGMQASRSQKVQHYKDLAEVYRSGNRLVAIPSFGGSSRSDKELLEANEDFLTPLVRRDDNDIDTGRDPRRKGDC